MRGSGLSFVILDELKEIGSGIELKFHVRECTKVLRKQGLPLHCQLPARRKDWLEHPDGRVSSERFSVID